MGLRSGSKQSNVLDLHLATSSDWVARFGISYDCTANLGKTTGVEKCPRRSEGGQRCPRRARYKLCAGFHGVAGRLLSSKTTSDESYVTSTKQSAPAPVIGPEEGAAERRVSVISEGNSCPPGGR